MSFQVVSTTNLDRLLTIESERLKTCASDKGFFQRLATISIPTLKQLKGLGEIVCGWEQELNDSQSVKDALNNLISFLQWHWDLAHKLNHRPLRSLVWDAVRKIRGPCRYVNWARSLAECISPTLDEILAIDIGGIERPSINQFREMQKVNILTTYQANQDCDPKYLWQSLRLVSSCWERRHERALSRKWNKPKGSFLQIILQAHNQTNEFLHDHVAEDFRALDQGKPLRYFKREKYQSFFDRLVAEFQLMLVYPNVDLLRKKESNLEVLLKIRSPKKNVRIPLEGSDEQNFCDWYKEWKKNTSTLLPHQKTQKMAIKAFRKQTRIKLESEYKDSTYLRWMTRHNKRSKSKK